MLRRGTYVSPHSGPSTGSTARFRLPPIAEPVRGVTESAPPLRVGDQSGEKAPAKTGPPLRRQKRTTLGSELAA